MSAGRGKKAGLLATGLILGGLYLAWKVIKLPFKAIGWAWHHKVAATVLAVACYVGWPGPTRAEKRAEARRVAVQRAEKNLAALAILNHTLSAPAPKIVSEEKLSQTAKQSQERETLPNQTSENIKPDPATVPAFSRLDSLLQDTAVTHQAADQMGAATIVFCDATNAYNAVMVRLGYVQSPQDGMNTYEIFRSSLVSDKGKGPLSAQINVRFTEKKGIRFGLNIDKEGIRQVQFKRGAPIIDLDGQNGRTLLVVSDNQLRLITDQTEVDKVFGYLNLDQPGAVYSQKFRAYTDSQPFVRRGRTEGYMQ